VPGYLQAGFMLVQHTERATLPIAGMTNMLCSARCRHLARVPDYLWVAEDGMKMQGYNGSQLWDTSFAVQALASTGLLQVAGQALRKAHHYVDASQVGVEGGGRRQRCCICMRVMRNAAHGAHGARAAEPCKATRPALRPPPATTAAFRTHSCLPHPQLPSAPTAAAAPPNHPTTQPPEQSQSPKR
jgi:hypothetical protein